MKPGAVKALVGWFSENARSLPWRGPIGAAREPYMVLVSESMLQQTQVSRVLERFPRFIERFPTIQALAQADERDVLAMWSGMGYYRRARNLHAAEAFRHHLRRGVVPRDLESLLELPGVGRYTAGAIASLSFGESAPIVDGNVARVMLRVHGREASTSDRAVQPWLWEQAAAVAKAGSRLGAFGAAAANEGMMELGATVCLPSPAAAKCEACPLSRACIARREGSQARIPTPKSVAPKRIVRCTSVVVRDGRGRVLLEQRGDDGMWAGMWQAPTIEREDGEESTFPSRSEIARGVGMRAAQLRHCGDFEHTTTHRTVLFQVYSAAAEAEGRLARGSWFETGKLDQVGISNAQLRVLRVAAESRVRDRKTARPVRPAAKGTG